MGYTPLFDSLTRGTLCGKWPDIGLWAVVLSMADKYGEVNATCQYIASVTGLALADVEDCMARFCEGDPESRTPDESGARLVLVSPPRRWGWRIVNHGKYRERARLAAKSAREVESGANRGRLAGRNERPPVTAGDRREPPETAPPNANANPYKREPKKLKGSPIPDDFSLTDAQRKKLLEKYPDADVEAVVEAFVAHHKAKATLSASWPHSWATWQGNLEKFGYPKRGSEKLFGGGFR